MDEILNGALNVATSATWATGGFFTAPQFDMSFIRCLQQSGNASIAAHAELRMISTPVSSMAAFRKLQASQLSDMSKAPFVYNISMTPEYQTIGKNSLGRTFIGKSYIENADGSRQTDAPQLEAQIINPFVCMPGKNGNGGLIFNYSVFFKNVVERGNTGSELSNSVSFSGAASLAFGTEKMLAVYEKENWVEQTIGLPILCRIPVIKYFFSTVTKIKERTYIVVTAEATPLDAKTGSKKHVSATSRIDRRMDNPIMNSRNSEKKAAPAPAKKAAQKPVQKSANKSAKKGNK
jgi:hypothetical protein